jgi:hypothetical protein
MIPKFDASNLTNIEPDDSAGASSFLPFGYAGILAAFVYGIWFFLAVEGVPLAAEETRDPQRDMPRGLIAAMLILLVFAALMLTLAPGGSGADTIAESDNPLPEAANAAYGGSGFVGDAVNYIGLAGLVASFFSIIFAYSRQLFALSRAGYFPRALSVTTKRRSPAIALILPGVVGFLLAAITEDGATMINIAVFGATVSYVLMMLSHIMLRSREPNLERPYRTPGGVVTSGIALVLAVAAVIATFFVDEKAALITLGVYLLAALYFGLYSRHHLVARRPRRSSPRSSAPSRSSPARDPRRAARARRPGRGRHGRHRPGRHAGPADGQAADRAPLPRGGGRARRRGVQLPARRRRRHEHGRGLRHGVVAGRLRRLRDGARPGHAAPVPWQPGTALCMADVTWGDGTPVPPSPRQILRRQLDRLAERGWKAAAGTELEFIVFRDTYEQAWHKAYRELEPANLYNVDYSLLGPRASSRSSAGSATT